MLLPSIFSLLSLILYTQYYSKYNKPIELLFILFFVYVFKLYILYMYSIDIYSSKFTYKDETTFLALINQCTFSNLESVLDMNIYKYGLSRICAFFSNYQFLNSFLISPAFQNNNFISLITPGDSFITNFGKIIYQHTFFNIYFVKILPIIFTIINFHYLIKITDNLKFIFIHKLIFILLCLILPSYIFFHSSFTKEFLQLTLLITSVYYSFKIFDKLNFYNIIKLLLSLVILAYTHRGFEILPPLFLFFIIIYKVFIFYFNANKFYKYLSIFILAVTFIFVIIIINLIQLDNLGFISKYFFIENFSDRINSVRSANDNYLDIDYLVLVNADTYINLIKSFLYFFIYYLFYINDFSSFKNIYYLLEMLLSCFIFISILSLPLINYNNFYLLKIKNNIIKLLFSFYIFIILSFSFSIFTNTIGNALRHK